MESVASEIASLDAIWTDDLFGRRSEAELLISYLEGISARPPYRQDARAYTVAVDASYGAGKTFFLSRLAKSLALQHPVAFVDAWADDLADEPLTALAATLKQALRPLLDQEEISSRWTQFMSKSGRVAKIVSLGLLKRGAALVITSGAAEALEDVISESEKEFQDLASDATKDASKGLVEDAAKAISTARPRKLMEQRIASFEDGKAATLEMKQSLSAIIASLTGQELRPPIYILIDELDRCRPTYAIKLLEEIKHLFDVPGLVFIFGLHGDQLAHSISGAYGSGFDGKAYLKRFLQRRYALAEVDFEPLVGALISRSIIVGSNLRSPTIALPRMRTEKPTLPRTISEYMVAFGLRPRDAFELVDMLETCCIIAKEEPLHLPYLLPLIIGYMKGLAYDELPSVTAPPKWVYYFKRDNWEAKRTLAELASDFQIASKWDYETLDKQMNIEYPSYAARQVFAGRHEQHRGHNGLLEVEGYPSLVAAVARFESAVTAAV